MLYELRYSCGIIRAAKSYRCRHVRFIFFIAISSVNTIRRVVIYFKVSSLEEGRIWQQRKGFHVRYVSRREDKSQKSAIPTFLIVIGKYYTPCTSRFLIVHVLISLKAVMHECVSVRIVVHVAQDDVAICVDGWEFQQVVGGIVKENSGNIVQGFCSLFW